MPNLETTPAAQATKTFKYFTVDGFGKWRHITLEYATQNEADPKAIQFAREHGARVIEVRELQKDKSWA